MRALTVTPEPSSGRATIIPAPTRHVGVRKQLTSEVRRRTYRLHLQCYWVPDRLLQLTAVRQSALLLQLSTNYKGRKTTSLIIMSSVSSANANASTHAPSIYTKINDLGWPWTANTHSCRKDAFYGADQKNLNEDRPIYILSLPAAIMWTMILVSRNIIKVRILAGVRPGGGFKRQWGCRRRQF